MTTDMNVQTENDVSLSETYETTCDTFHTAQTNCSNLSSPTIGDDDTSPLSNCTLSSGELEDDDDDTISDSGIRKSKSSSPSSSITANTDLNSKSSNSTASGSLRKVLALPNAVMSDSGVCLDPIKNVTANQNAAVSSAGDQQHQHVDGLPCNSDDETASCSSCEINTHSDSVHPHCPMHNLRRKIASQKALIMKNLEMNVNKTKLDEQISELQELQKRYVKMEKHAMENSNSMEDHHLCCNALRDFDNNDDDNNESNAAIESSPYMPNMTRSWPSVRDFRKSLFPQSHAGTNYYFSAETEHFITVPTFVVRGAGKQTHYEYEVRIALPDGKLNILRRYSRFRELHMSMKNVYGAKVSLAIVPLYHRSGFSNTLPFRLAPCHSRLGSYSLRIAKQWQSIAGVCLNCIYDDSLLCVHGYHRARYMRGPEDPVSPELLWLNCRPSSRRGFSRMAGTGRDNSYPTAKLYPTYSVSFNIFLLFVKLHVTSVK